MLHQQKHNARSIRSPQERRKPLRPSIKINHRFRPRPHSAINNRFGDRIIDFMAGDVAEVADGGLSVCCDGGPECEGEVGPEDCFGGGFAVFEGGDEAVVGGEGVEVVGSGGGGGGETPLTITRPIIHPLTPAHPLHNQILKNPQHTEFRRPPRRDIMTDLKPNFLQLRERDWVICVGEAATF